MPVGRAERLGAPLSVGRLTAFATVAEFFFFLTERWGGERWGGERWGRERWGGERKQEEMNERRGTRERILFVLKLKFPEAFGGSSRLRKTRQLPPDSELSRLFASPDASYTSSARRPLNQGVKSKGESVRSPPEAGTDGEQTLSLSVA